VGCRDLLIPVRTSRPGAGRFTWPGGARLFSGEAADRLPLRQLRSDLSARGVRARLAGPPDGAAVVVRRSRRIADPEAYELTVRPKRIEIVAAADAGAYYAVQTLRDLLDIHGSILPAMRVKDAPDFRRRGVYHDCSRGKVPKVRTVKQLIERLGRWKINELQLYIENTFQYAGHPDIGVGYSPFTAADILAIQDHCRKHHIRLVGSLASFGHMEKILCLPRYRHLAEAKDFETDAKGDLCPTDPAAIKFLADLYGEFLPLVEAEDFNACCDETRQIGQGRSRRRAEKIGLGRLYLEFVLKIRRLCRRHGKRLNIWGDIILAHPEIIPEIPKDIVMLNWDYSPDGSRIDRTDEFAAAGLPLVCCPGTNAWQSHGSRLGQANANISKFARVGRRHQAEGLLNTDWGDGGHRNTLGVSLHGFALGAAHAWCGARVDDRRFTERFCRQVFADRSGRLAAAVKALGAFGGGQLYHALLEPFDPTLPWRDYMIGYATIGDPRLSGRAVRRRLEVTDALRFGRPAKHLPEFGALALAEFDLARRMDHLACRRVLAGRDLRAGRRVGPRTLRSLARAMADLADDFAALWRARNRPSRLRYNLKAMRAVAAEAERLAR